MTPIRTYFVAILFTLLGTLAFAADGSLLPSEVTVLARHAILANPSAGRKTITVPLVARMQTDGLSEIERYMKGEAHFLNLEPEESRDEFWNFRNRDDDLGRVANQRLMVIRINAFQMVDELLEKDIPNYRERFGSRANDRYGITFPVSRTALLLIDRGDVDVALDLVVEEVRRHDKFDAPYTAYTLVGQFFSTAREHGRGAEFAELHDWIVAGLSDVIAKRLATPGKDAPQDVGLPGFVFSSLYEDRRLGYVDWTAEFIKLRDRMVASVTD